MDIKGASNHPPRQYEHRS